MALLKVIWRFQYQKYKGLRAGRSGNCGECRLKKVQFAYRNLCDGCAKTKKAGRTFSPTHQRISAQRKLPMPLYVQYL